VGLVKPYCLPYVNICVKLCHLTNLIFVDWIILFDRYAESLICITKKILVACEVIWVCLAWIIQLRERDKNLRTSYFVRSL